jgi:hypothetical protein
MLYNLEIEIKILMQNVEEKKTLLYYIFKISYVHIIKNVS